MKKLTKEEKEVIYYALSRVLDTPMSQVDFNLVDTLRDKFKTK